MDAVPHEQTTRPVRLVVTDDLARTRVTVLFRLLLAIPLLLWLVVWSLAAFTVVFVVWLAVLFERRAPRTPHRFLASYVRYTVHVSAYLSLSADPYPSFSGTAAYPVDVEIAPAATQGRWGAAFRLLLAVPALVLASTLGGSGLGAADPEWAFASASGALAVVGVLGWFACLVRAAMPRGMRDLGLFAIGYTAQTYAYLLLLTDRYPSADPALAGEPNLPEHPVRIDVTDDLVRPRLGVLFRLLLTLPHLVWIVLWSVAVAVVVVLAWIAALITGHVPDGLQRFLAAYVRYRAHLTAFATLVGGPFPGFNGIEGSYPVDVTIVRERDQPRAATLFRLVLCIPAALLAGAYAGVLLAVAVLTWFYALWTGRMPSGLRNIGAVAIRYQAQLDAFSLLVTNRYPYAAPYLADAAHDEQLQLELGDPAVGVTR